MSNQFRILLLKIAASLAALMAGGCNMPNVAPQPVTPVVPAKQTLDINVNVGGGAAVTVAGGAEVNVNQTRSSGDAARCDCGCEKESCRCSSRSLTRPAADTSARSGPQIVSALRDSKPVVEMLSDFEDGQCGACDLAWSDWKANGSSWPFVLTKRRGAGGRTSPTFVMPSGKSWSPSSYSVGGLAEYWRAKK